MNSSPLVGKIHVFTFKDGLLSSIAHDLRLTLERFEVLVDGETVKARFYPATLNVDGPMRGGRLDEAGLSARVRREIHGNICDKILQIDRFPEISFEGQLAGPSAVRGALTMKGRKVDLTIQVFRRDDGYVGHAELSPSRWGIAPFKALLGAIRLQDRVRIEFDVTVGRTPQSTS